MDIRNVTSVIIHANSITLVFGKVQKAKSKSPIRSRNASMSHYRDRHLRTRITADDWKKMDRATRNLPKQLKLLYDTFRGQPIWKEKELSERVGWIILNGPLNSHFRRAGLPHRILVDPSTRYSSEFTHNRTYRVYKLRK